MAKRKLSKYNLHMKSCLKGLKGKSKVARKAKFKACATSWKKKR